MPKKRNTGLPKITQLPSGAYHAQVYSHTDATGKRRYESFTGFDYNQVLLEVAQFKADKKRQKIEDSTAKPVMTLREAFTAYIDSRTNVTSPSTLVGYKQIARNALPELMPVPLDEITQELVQVAINAEAETKAPKTIRNIHGLLSAVLHSYRPEITLTTTLPVRRKTEMAIPSKAEVEKMMDDVRGTVMELPFVLGAFCGLRRSEISALRWDDIDLDADLVYVRHALVLNEDKQWVCKPPKTTAGDRIVPMYHPAIKDAFLRVRAEEGAANPPYITINPDHITQRTYHVCQRAQTRVYTFHQLRHYCVSVMLALGFPEKYIASLVGHEGEQMIRRCYAHIMAEKREEFQKKVADFYQTNLDPIDVIKGKIDG